MCSNILYFIKIKYFSAYNAYNTQVSEWFININSLHLDVLLTSLR